MPGPRGVSPADYTERSGCAGADLRGGGWLVKFPSRRFDRTVRDNYPDPVGLPGPPKFPGAFRREVPAVYSLLLMSAMATGPETAEFHGFFRDLFSLHGGCTGSRTGNRTASGCSGSRASSGCYGSGSGRTSAGAGSCTGRAYSSCNGSGYASCCGGGSASGSAMRTAPYTSAPMPAVVYTYAPPSNCTGSGFGGSGSMIPMTPMFTEPPPSSGVPFAQPQPATPPATIPETRNFLLRQASYVTATPDRATVTVRLPADATLYAEGRRLQLTGDTRAFVTPPLPPGEYGYTFRAEYVRGGEVLSRTRQVAVRAGGAATVEFAEFDLASRPVPSSTPAVAIPAVIPSVPPPPPSVPAGPSGSLVTKAVAPIAPTATPASKSSSPTPAVVAGPKAVPARITVKLPPGAVLYVDGKRHDRTESVRRFDTPPVPAGQTFTYAVRVDMPQGSGPVAQSESVTVRGGDDREVDFTRPLPTERAGR